MTDLLAKLEAATEGSRELECRMAIALFDPEIMVDPGGYGPGAHPAKYQSASTALALEGWKDWEGLANILDAKRWTTSIDAALTLADPEDAVGLLHSVTWQRHTGDLPVDRVALEFCRRFFHAKARAA